MTMLAMPWIATGTFVYQSFITSSKGLGSVCNRTIFYGLFNIICNLTLFISGFLIDKFTSRKLLIYMNIPLFVATDCTYSYFD